MTASPDPMDEAVLRARRRQEDEQVVARYAAGAGRGHDMRPMREFVEKVRRDLGPRAVITDVEINGQPRDVSAWVVWYFFPGEEMSTMQIPDRPGHRPAGRGHPERLGRSGWRMPRPASAVRGDTHRQPRHLQQPAR